MACQQLKKLLSELVMSIPELARAASLSEKSVRNVIKGKHRPQARIMRQIIAAINEELEKKNRPAVGPEIFT